MAFESLSEKLKRILKSVRGQARLSEKNMDDMLKEVRVALLEADVNFKVVNDFIDEVKSKALGAQVYLKLNPSEMVVKIVRDELVDLLGSRDSRLHFASGGPTVIMLVGLQGSGKTTTAGKLAYLLREKEHKRALLAALDVYRPAAIDQLREIARKADVDFYFNPKMFLPTLIAKEAEKKAADERYDALILDTAGRLQIDEPLMEELVDIKNETKPEEILLLVDAMSGQDAVNVAETFNEKVGLTGVILSKLDGDARGGAALSIKRMSGLPIKFCGLGETLKDLDVFHPDRMADRILGMGDVVTLVEKVQTEIGEKEAEKTAKKMMAGRFTLDDMLRQMKQVRRLGSLGSILKLIPGMPSITPEQKAAAEKEMKILEAVVNSMTKEEREHPEILRNSRKIRIARGSGRTSADINRILRKFNQMQEMMRQVNQYKKTGRLPPGMGGLGR